MGNACSTDDLNTGVHFFQATPTAPRMLCYRYDATIVRRPDASMRLRLGGPSNRRAELDTPVRTDFQ